MKFLYVLVIVILSPNVFGGNSSIKNDEEHNFVYEKGTSLIVPHMILLGQNRKPSNKDINHIKQGILYLDEVTKYNPKNWSAYWAKGKGYQILKQHENSYYEFKQSFHFQNRHPDVARELASSCLELGLGDEAVEVTKHAISLTPEDAGLYANLALAYLIVGKNAEAHEAVNKSLQMEPKDRITKYVKKVVDEVLKGKRAQPKKMSDFY